MLKSLGLEKAFKHAYSYNSDQDLLFSVGGATICKQLRPRATRFKIDKYLWTFSVLTLEDREQCFTDEDFRELNVTTKQEENGRITVVKGSFPLRHIKVCVKINAHTWRNKYFVEYCVSICKNSLQTGHLLHSKGYYLILIS